MSGLLDCAFEEEVVHDNGSASDEFHKGFGKFDIRTLLEQVLGPFHKDSSHRTGIEVLFPILSHLLHFWAGERPFSEKIDHISSEDFFLVDGSLQQKLYIFIDGLVVHVGRIRKRLRGEMIKKVNICRRGLNLGEWIAVDYLWLIVFFFYSFEESQDSLI